MKAGNDSNQSLWMAWLTACQSLGVSVTPEQQAALERFYALLVEANRTTNLTRITALPDFLERHLLDSLTIVPLVPTRARVVDVGTGAGFPAIPLAIVRPDVQVTAVESVGKKCQFIQAVIETLALPNLTVLNMRSETLGHEKNHRHSYDVAVARAVAALPVLLELCLPLVKPEGRFLAMKGLSYEAELTASTNALQTLHACLVKVHEFAMPSLSGSRLIEFEKTGKTPPAYPRQPGLAAKKPL